MNLIIDPSTLTEEQREAIKEIYNTFHVLYQIIFGKKKRENNE